MTLKKNYRIILFFLLVLFSLDIFFAGAGKWSEVFGFSFRKYLYFLIITFSVFGFLVFCNFRLNIIFYLLLICLFFFIWVFFIPYIYGRSLSNAFSDGQLFFGMIFLLFFSYSVVETGVYGRYKVFLFVLLRILAFLHLSLYFAAYFFTDVFLIFIERSRDFLEPFRAAGETSILIGVEDGAIRIFWGASILLLLYFYFEFKRFLHEGRIFGVLLAIVAILVTATRSMLLAIIIFVFYYILINSLFKIKIPKNILFVVFLLLMFLQTLPVVMMADPDLLKIIGISRAVSDDLRFEQINSLTHQILEKPWFGGGLGAYAEVVRAPDAPWSYEMSIYALYMKIGVVGLVLLLINFYFLIDAKIFVGDRKISEFSCILSLILAFNFCANTNPFLFSLIGVFFVYIIHSEYIYVLNEE